MEINEGTLELVAEQISPKRPIVIVGRCGQGREFFVSHVFSLLVEKLGGTINIESHGNVKGYHKKMEVKDSSSILLSAYFDCDVVNCKEVWKDIAHDRSHGKILSCQLNSLGRLSQAFIQNLFELFGTFTLIQIEVNENNDYDINMMHFGV